MGIFKQSFSWWCFENRGLAPSTLFKKAIEIGYQGVDLLPVELWDEARGAGLEIVNHSGHRPLEEGFNDTRFHKRIIDDTLRNLELAARYQVPVLTVFSGNRGGLSDEEGLANTVLGLQQVTTAAEKLGVTLVLELLNSKIDHPGHQCDRTSWGVAVCRMVGSPRLRLLYDIYHMQIMEGDVIHTLRENIAWIAHIHTGGVPGRADLDDTQELYYPAIVRALADCGYHGYIGHEFLPKGEPLSALKQAFQACEVEI